MPSSKYLSSSWLSCCWNPLKRGALLETTHSSVTICVLYELMTTIFKMNQRVQVSWAYNHINRLQVRYDSQLNVSNEYYKQSLPPDKIGMKIFHLLMGNCWSPEKERHFDLHFKTNLMKLSVRHWICKCLTNHCRSQSCNWERHIFWTRPTPLISQQRY